MMEFSTRMKGRIPEAVVEYLLAEKKPNATTRRVVNASGRGIPFSDSSSDSLGEISQRTTLGGEPDNGEDFDATFLVDEEWLHPRKKYILNTCVERRDKVQLVMELPAVLSNGEVRNLKVLIDTGAQANLVRKGLISSHLFYGAPRILKLIAANGQRIEGGDRVVDVHLQFCCERDGKMLEHMIEYPCTFHEAAIRVDAILSFPWLREQELGVFPHKKALVTELPTSYLYGLRNRDLEHYSWGSQIHGVRAKHLRKKWCGRKKSGRPP